MLGGSLPAGLLDSLDEPAPTSHAHAAHAGGGRGAGAGAGAYGGGAAGAGAGAGGGRGQFPEDCMCPLTHDVMQDPVTDVLGHSYERRAIEEWQALGEH